MEYRARARTSRLLRSISVFALPFLGLAIAAPAMAQSPDDGEIVIVTGTRRATNIQDTPVNIAAVGRQEIEEQGLAEISELANYVPGLHIIDQGGHASSPIIVRGLNADPIGPNDGANNGGGTVATYVGEIPLFVEMRLEDMEQVEVLMGPQGTLYGAGTLGGAIRYIPRRPQFDAATVQLRGDVYDYSEGEDLSTDLGVTFNVPFSDTFAIRGSVDQLRDTGFIDYNYIVREMGVSDPDGFSDPTNFSPVADANDEDVISGRLAVRAVPAPWWEVNLTYYYQDAQIGGRQISSHVGLIPVDHYVSTKRVRETFDRTNALLALEQTLDLGFAELTSATGYSEYDDASQRDQTDLLIGLNPGSSYYYYENFPTFTSFTYDTTSENTFTQELRLVSTNDGPLSWILGAFYSSYEGGNESREFTPEFSEYLFNDPLGVGYFSDSIRSDDLEYFNVSFAKLVESAAYGEIGYDFTPNWNVTIGGRYYEYELETTSATDFPLLETQFGRPDGEIVLDFIPGGQSDDGFLWKFNTSYRFSEDVLTYFTRSEGYRIGNSNDVAPCDPNDVTQTVCGQPDEIEYTADITTNYELGIRTTWLDGRLLLNGAIFHIDWEGPQVAGATLIGLQPITKNGANAQTEGVEINFNWDITDRFSVRGSAAHTRAELTEISPNLITLSNSANDFLLPALTGDPVVDAPFIPFYDLGGAEGDPRASFRVPGLKGDRLPGSPEYQYSLFFNYNLPTSAGSDWDFTYWFAGIGDVEQLTGGRGTTLPAYSIHNASVRYSTQAWAVTLYAKNLWDEFAASGATGSTRSNYIFTDDAGGPVYLRSHYLDVLPPRTIGLRFTYDFGG
jgi:outer membrane receptor protein involved in Fe transport